MESSHHSPGHGLRELVALPASPSAWLLAATLFFAAIPSVSLPGTAVSACFVLFVAAVAAGAIERALHREYWTRRALRVAGAAYLFAAFLLTLSYMANALELLMDAADPAAVRGHGPVPVLPGNFMAFLWGTLGPQEPQFAGLLATAVLMPLVTLAVRIKSWREFRFVLLVAALGSLFGAAYVVAYCNGLLSGQWDRTWVLLGRAQGLTAHPNILGINSMLAFPPLLLLLFECRNRMIKLAALTGMVVAWAAIDYSGSRSAAGGVFALIAATLLAHANSRRALVRAAVQVGVLAAAAVLTVYVLMPLAGVRPKSALLRLAGGGRSSDTARDIISTVVGEQLWDNPIFGAGYQVLMVAHNIYVQLIHAAGAVGLLGYAITLAIPLAALRSLPLGGSGHSVRACLAAAIATFILLYSVKSNPSYFGLALLFSLAFYAGMAQRMGSVFDPLARGAEPAADPVPQARQVTG
jgi:hypothetical protein